MTVDCPLDCPYLLESRKHEIPDVRPADLPHQDVKVDEQFLERNEALLILLASRIATTALTADGIVDNDVKEALEALVRTYRTLQSGLVYDNRPDNPLAATIVRDVRQNLADIEQRLSAQGQGLRDADVLKMLVFLQRLEIQNNNKRPKSRAFIQLLSGFFPPDALRSRDERSGLIITP